ncbi:DUF6684 family protein [Halopiger djelfimassiliensis]|uniref:DUF6684 family protein n=1 Tax=Halopiger djelfimassiliensis TaxID=1293047 RepID=UPI0006777624|nr:DUF6684 family protein [Halopiger djelfimassiliensis]
MSRRAFDAEIALDLAVNLIPLAIIVFFVVLFAAFNPWGFDPLRSTIQFAVLLSVIILLGLVTVLSARVIEGDERTRGQEREQ